VAANRRATGRAGKLGLGNQSQQKDEWTLFSSEVPLALNRYEGFFVALSFQHCYSATHCIVHKYACQDASFAQIDHDN
jgi:hypothetical protein